MKSKRDFKLIILLTTLFIIALLYFLMNVFNLLNMNMAQAVSAEVVQIPEIQKNKNPINIDKILSENRNISLREEMVYEQMDLEYTTKYINNDKLPTGTIHVTQIGSDGKQDVITIKKYNGEEFISEQIVASNVIKTPINKIVEIGTGKRKK